MSLAVIKVTKRRITHCPHDEILSKGVRSMRIGHDVLSKLPVKKEESAVYNLIGQNLAEARPSLCCTRGCDFA